MGYRTDIPELLKASDLFVFPSLQEGLPVALMEAMSCGIPCIASKIRGNADLLDCNMLCDANDIRSLRKKLEENVRPALLLTEFDADSVTKKMKNLFNNFK